MNKYDALIGKVLDGRYKILELVGMGGMACVLKAQDLVMKRIVAIKILNDEYNGNAAAEARFIDESKAVAMLSNKYIVSVYDVAIYPDIKYIVMEYLDGITLREYLDNKGAIGWKEACVYTLQILRALEHAHSKGIIHRDIKPQNVMLMKNGDIKVTDFGIAKLPNSELPDSRDEKAIGTVYYISPEQACGKDTDLRSDIYSVGVMLYEAVTGKLPFTAETPMEIAMMQVNDDPVNPRDIILDIPVGVSQIILKAMEKAPSDRFVSAHAMAKAIEWVLKYPDVIFSVSDRDAADGSTVGSGIVSIDMIDTSEIEPYNENEMAESLGKKKHGEQPVKKKPHSKKPRRSTMFPIIAAVCSAFLIVTAVIAVFTLRYLKAGYDAQQTENDNKTYRLPNLVGKLYSDQLVTELENNGYGECRIKIDDVVTVNDPTLENDYIVATEPSGNERKKPAEDGYVHFSQITVNVSEKRLVPDLNGLTKTEAETKLKNLRLNAEFAEDSDTESAHFPECSGYFNNQVLGTLPEAGSEIKVGDTVTVYVRVRSYDTEKTAPMPNCIGMTEADARRFAQVYAKFKVEFERVAVVGGDGRVHEQSVKAGVKGNAGDVVTFTIHEPIAADSFKDYRGMQFANALAALYETPDVDINNIIFTFMQAGGAASREQILIDGKGARDSVACLSALLNDGCVSASGEVRKGTVVFQSLKPGSQVEKGEKIEIIVVIFEDDPDLPEPDPNPEPDPDPTPDPTPGGGDGN